MQPSMSEYGEERQGSSLVKWGSVWRITVDEPNSQDNQEPLKEIRWSTTRDFSPRAVMTRKKKSEGTDVGNGRNQ